MDKRTAARRAGLIEGNIADISVLDKKAFHILPANVQNERDLRAKFLRRPQMGKGLDLARVGVNRRFYDPLAVTGRQRRSDILPRSHPRVKGFQLLNNRVQRRAAVFFVSRIEKLAIFPDHRQLRRRRSGVESQIQRSLIRGEISLRHLRLIVAGVKRRILRLILEQDERRRPRFQRRLPLRFAHTIFQPTEVHDLAFAGERRPHSDEITAVPHRDNIVRREFQRFNKAFSKLRQKIERPP